MFHFPISVPNVPLIYQGKTRDTYETKDPSLMLVFASDRLSTHNVVHESLVERKGEMLTAITIFWLDGVFGPKGINHHLVAYGAKIYSYLPGKREDYPSNLHHRAIVVRKLDIIPVEFIYRNYLIGSIFDKFYSEGLENPYGIDLLEGLPKMYRFDKTIFTPTEKSETDDPVRSSQIELRFPEATAMGMKAHDLIRKLLNSFGIEFIDTKFEFGIDESGKLFLADEVGTPDSSRMCLLSDIKEGEDPPWLDKQIARNEAKRIWGGGPPAPLVFDKHILNTLTEKYEELFRRITGSSLQDFQRLRLDY